MNGKIKASLSFFCAFALCFSAAFSAFANKDAAAENSSSSESEETGTVMHSTSNDTTSAPETDSETTTRHPLAYTLGDVNGDGNVSAVDARLTLRFSAKLELFTDEQYKAADYDKNGEITAVDARCILRKAAGLDPFAKPTVPTTVPTTRPPETTTRGFMPGDKRSYKYEPKSGFNASHARYAVLYDYDNDVILYGKNMHTRCHPASTTKLITACLGCEYLSPDYVLTVGSEQNLLEVNTSRAGIYRGQKIKFKEILKCLLVPSGCDAAYTIAVNVARVAAGSPNMSASNALRYFINMMNNYAKKLGMNDSHFANPDGFPNSNHYVSAYDMMIIGTKAYSFSLIRNIVNQPYATAYFVSGGSKSYTNSDELINKNSSRYYPYAVGIKTGSHSQAGQCLVSAAVKRIDRTGKNKTFIAVVMNCPDKYGRYTDLKNMFNTGFAYYWR